MLRHFLVAAIYLLWTAAVFDPIGKFFALRYIALLSTGVALVASGAYLRLLQLNIRTAAVILVSVLMPLYGLVLYALNGGYTSKFIDTSYAAAGVLMLSSLLYKDLDLCRIGITAMVSPLRLLALVILAVYGVVLFSSSYEWVGFFTVRDVALVSTREFNGVTLPYIYFLASPMLIYLIAYDLGELTAQRTTQRLLLLICSLTAFAFSGTRAHILLAITYPAFYYALLRSRQQMAIGVFSALLVIFAVGAAKIPILDAFLSPGETDNALKLRMLSNYADMLDDPLTLLFGQGYNAHSWSASLRDIIATEQDASKSELTYVELVRVYGVVMSLPFFALVVVVTRRLYKMPHQFSWLYPAFLIYLINSSINPYLFSSNGILPLGLMIAILANQSNQGRLKLSDPVKLLTNNNRKNTYT